MKKLPLVILIFGIVLSLFSQLPSFNNPFRSDDWYIANLSFKEPLNLEGIKKSLKFELFGDPRFQPLSHLLVFFTHKLFGARFFLYHIFAYSLHLLNFFLLFYLLKLFHKESLLPALIAVLFLNIFSHADIIIWAYHNYIVAQVATILGSFLLLMKGIEKGKVLYGGISSVLLLSACLYYEAAILIPLLVALLMLAFYGDMGSGKKKVVKVFWAITFLLYAILIPLIFGKSTSPLSNQGIEGIYSLIKEIVIAFWITMNGIIRVCFYDSLIFPPMHYYEDLFYIVMPKFSIFAILFWMVFVFYFIVFPSSTKERRSFLIYWALSLFTYLFIISFGRKCFYSITQARYLYLPNIILLIIFSFIIKDLFRFKLNSWNELKNGNVKPQLFIKNYFILIYFIFLILINAKYTYAYCLDLNSMLRPLVINIEEINKYYKKYGDEGRLLVDFVPHNKDNKIFLGTHIALETIFFNKPIFTRFVNKASHIYSYRTGVRQNPLKGVNLGNDFTIEFDLERIRCFEDISILNSKDYFLRINIVNGVEELIFGGFWYKGNSKFFQEFKANLMAVPLSHLVVQKEGDYLYFIQNSKLLFKENIGNAELPFRDKDLFVGSSITFPTQYCFVENFFCIIGKAKYKLTNYKAGSNVFEPGLKPIYEAMGSRPVYWFKAIDNLYED